MVNIRKRDGRIVPFDKEKISKAIFNAAKSVGGEDQKIADELTDKALTIIDYQFDEKAVPTVEEIQDIIERVLIKSGFSDTAKAYILYRHQHEKVRETKATFLDVENTISEYLDESDWRTKENSNTDYSFSGLMLHTAGKVIANYVLNEIYTPQMKDAHVKGYLHIHDLSNGVVGYCAGWSLKNLLKMGFGNVPNKVDTKPAKHMDVVVSQMINYIGCLQMEFAGAQAFSSVDTLLAPFVRSDNLSYKQVKQNMQRLVFSLNIPSRWGSQMPFSNLTFDWTVPEDMKEEKAIVGGKELDTTYGDYQKEMDMINQAFLEVMKDGDSKGRIFTFPIPTYNLYKDFEWESDNAKLLFEVTAKYGTPYFQNYVGSDLDPKSIRAMCCRLNLNTLELMNRPGGMWGPGDSTGSVGVVTMNLNRLGYEAKDKEDFYKRLKHYMDIAKDSLEIKRKMVEKNLETGLMPYTKAYLGTFKNHFSTIGLVGMNECVLNFLGKDIMTEEGKAFAIEALEKMRDIIRGYQQETGNLYNLEATPAESTSYRLAKLDKEMYPDIKTSGKCEPYLTNSTQVPVNHTENLITALEHQNDIQPLYTGGTMFHTFLGEKMANGQSCMELVKKIAYNTKLPYFSVTPTFSVCSDHGYITGEEPECPQCGSVTEVYSRIVGYYRPVKNWNKGKKSEFEDRVTFKTHHDFKKKEEITAQSPACQVSSVESETTTDTASETRSDIAGTASDSATVANAGTSESAVAGSSVGSSASASASSVLSDTTTSGSAPSAPSFDASAPVSQVASESDGGIMSYKIFTMPSCQKCESAKLILAEHDLKGTVYNLADNDDIKEFRNYYKDLKDQIKRNDDGSLPVPTILFLDKEQNVVKTATSPDELKQIVPCISRD
ncbi:ribonucleoside triphosphate reductase [Candidatus Woesearchaeota archaeon]|nr:ribonucleoside triphosphate reductase [Candidatus Woesearchaeota archaeon]